MLASSHTGPIARAKIIGILIRDARQAVGKTLEECALTLGVSEEKFKQFEQGTISPSLPELESLTYYLEVSPGYFWEQFTSKKLEKTKKKTEKISQLIQLRQKIIGALIRQARLGYDISIDQMAAHFGIEISQLEAYEFGHDPIPFPLLEQMCGYLNRSIREFQDQQGPIGKWVIQQRAVQEFLELPLDFQLFVSRPVNRPYLDIAIRMSEMQVDRLRAVAEGLLEITY
jgi:transcriptional regulator with XRE-family HTH domain